MEQPMETSIEQPIEKVRILYGKQSLSFRLPVIDSKRFELFVARYFKISSTSISGVAFGTEVRSSSSFPSPSSPSSSSTTTSSFSFLCLL